MTQITRIKNNTLVTKKWAGQSVLSMEYYTIDDTEIDSWKEDSALFAAVAAGEAIVNNGTDLLIPTAGWKWLLGDTLPKSTLGNKLAIHSSAKPAISGKELYLVWTGAGDDVTGSPLTVGEGDLLQFQMTPDVPVVIHEVKFNPLFGTTYIHEGHASWEGAGSGDYIHAVVVASPSQLQTSTNLDLVIANNWVAAAPGGAGSGTHGFALSPILLRVFKDMDGDWDYDTVNGLVSNLTGTGEYKISDIEHNVHKYINKIPVLGNSYGYTRLTSDETALLPEGYFLRIMAHNKSNTTWNACVFLEVFREQTEIL